MFTREILQCPVGKEVLGYRHTNEAAILTCDDCDFQFIWEPNNSVPKAKKVDRKDHSCGCHTCSE